jgi:triosephosphate isomerase
MSRRPIVVGNWKMHGDRAQTRALLEGLKARLGGLSGVEVGVAPPFTALETAGQVLPNDELLIAAQNVHYERQGAFTGEVSPQMLKELGVDLVIVGHSERRQLFGETDEDINRKVKASLSASLGVILCVGETLAEREGGRTLQQVSSQVKAGLLGVSVEALSGVVLAYEPVWAIGTGKTATPAQAQDVHAELRALLGRMYGEAAASGVRIIYGGSVKPDNAAELLSQEDIDGALVGGASLQAESFEAIVRALPRLT